MESHLTALFLSSFLHSPPLPHAIFLSKIPSPCALKLLCMVEEMQLSGAGLERGVRRRGGLKRKERRNFLERWCARSLVSH